MRKAIYVGGIVAVLAGLILTGVPSADAQDRNRIIRSAPFLALLGPGSGIGITVRDSDAGVLVEEVREGSPAARAGLKREDLVIDFDGERARSATQFTRLVRETAPGRAVKITVARGGSRQTLDITPEARGSADIAQPNLSLNIKPAVPPDFTFDFNARPFLDAFSFSPRRLGVTVTPITPQLATYFGVKQGVLVTEVVSGSPAEAAGVRAGDVITAINGRTVSTTDDVVQGVRDSPAGASVELRVTRERRELTLTPKLPEASRPTAGGGRPI